jgi:hypothetical protein
MCSWNRTPAAFKNASAAGLRCAKRFGLGIVTRTYGFAADQVNVPRPSTLTSLPVIFTVTASTTNEPK